MSLLPGKDGKEFYFQLPRDAFRKGDIICQGDFQELIVTKVYPFTWWRKLLRRIGFPVRMMQCRVSPYPDPA